MKQVDLVHIHRALKIANAIIAESPELVSYDEADAFMVAWIVVQDELQDRYKGDMDEDADD